jgi:hypothetical protein
MLPDLRFVFGATLAIAMLAVAGFGFAISSQLLHQARVGSLEPTQSLAYAGRAEDNPFYDPDSALRFTKALTRPDEATPQPPLAKLPDPVPALPTTSAESDKLADPAPAPLVEPVAVTPPPSEGLKPPEAEAAGKAPTEPERVASAPAASPGEDIRKEGEAPPAAAESAADAPPAPARKPAHHKPRPKITRAPRPPDQTFQNSGVPTGDTWPSYNDSWGTPPAAKKKNGTVAGR